MLERAIGAVLRLGVLIACIPYAGDVLSRIVAGGGLLRIEADDLSYSRCRGDGKWYIRILGNTLHWDADLNSNTKGTLNSMICAEQHPD